VALTLLFTSPGVPCLYYGDEIGMQGGADPDCRRPFPWRREDWNHALLEHVQGLIEQRRQRAEWRHGAVQTLTVGADHLVFARYTGNAATLVALNRGPAVQIALPLQQLPLAPRVWRDQNGCAVDPPLMAHLPARAARLWLADAAA